MGKLLSHSKLFLNRNASTILTVIGGAGVVATAVLAVRETPKAMRNVQEVTEENQNNFLQLTIF